MQFWSGVLLLSFGAVIALPSVCPGAVDSAGRIHTLVIALFSIMAGLKLAIKYGNKKKLVALLIWATTGVIILAVLQFIPWFFPTYYGDLRFGWSKQTNMKLGIVFACILALVGGFLIIGQFIKLNRRSQKGARIQTKHHHANDDHEGI